MVNEVELFGSVGGERIVVVPYDPTWPEQFAAWRDRLSRALGPNAVAVKHVGSTAVPGLAAKPVIDVQVSVADVENEPEYRPAIESTGLFMRAREPEHRYFRHDVASGQARQVHVHVCAAGSAWERDHLTFRDYLRAHPARRDAYASLKRELAAVHAADRLAYTQAKDAFVAKTLEMAQGH